MEKKKTLSEYEEIARKRIKQLVDKYCNGSQQIFADRTGLNKASVSQYINGKNTPSTKTAEKIAAAFHCDPEWVMGFSSRSELEGYYTSDALEAAQKLFEDRDMRILFDAARDSRPEDLQMAADLLKRLKATNPEG
jgi:transcriptional regulator with XRE-family HTH domain